MSEEQEARDYIELHNDFNKVKKERDRYKKALEQIFHTIPSGVQLPICGHGLIASEALNPSKEESSK